MEEGEIVRYHNNNSKASEFLNHQLRTTSQPAPHLFPIKSGSKYNNNNWTHLPPGNRREMNHGYKGYSRGIWGGICGPPGPPAPKSSGGSPGGAPGKPPGRGKAKPGGKPGGRGPGGNPWGGGGPIEAVLVVGPAEPPREVVLGVVEVAGGDVGVELGDPGECWFRFCCWCCS